MVKLEALTHTETFRIGVASHKVGPCPFPGNTANKSVAICKYDAIRLKIVV